MTVSPRLKVVTVRKPKRHVRERIIDAAYHCFERYGVQKTTMEDIASVADCSRQTVYKSFPGKEDIVTEICLLESAKMNAQIKKRLHRRQNLASKMTESIMMTMRVGRANPYVRRFIQPIILSSRTTDVHNPIHATHRAYWAPLLQSAIKSGEMAADLDIDDVVSWITLAQSALLAGFDSPDANEAQLERMVRRFIVAPLLIKNEHTKT